VPVVINSENAVFALRPFRFANMFVKSFEIFKSFQNKTNEKGNFLHARLAGRICMRPKWGTGLDDHVDELTNG
jgi:hypothetical protein